MSARRRAAGGARARCSAKEVGVKPGCTRDPRVLPSCQPYYRTPGPGLVGWSPTLRTPGLQMLVGWSRTLRTLRMARTNRHGLPRGPARGRPITEAVVASSGAPGPMRSQSTGIVGAQPSVSRRSRGPRDTLAKSEPADTSERFLRAFTGGLGWGGLVGWSRTSRTRARKQLVGWCGLLGTVRE